MAKRDATAPFNSEKMSKRLDIYRGASEESDEEEEEEEIIEEVEEDEIGSDEEIEEVEEVEEVEEIEEIEEIEEGMEDGEEYEIIEEVVEDDEAEEDEEPSTQGAQSMRNTEKTPSPSVPSVVPTEASKPSSPEEVPVRNTTDILRFDTVETKQPTQATPIATATPSTASKAQPSLKDSTSSQKRNWTIPKIILNEQKPLTIDDAVAPPAVSAPATSPCMSDSTATPTQSETRTSAMQLDNVSNSMKTAPLVTSEPERQQSAVSASGPSAAISEEQPIIASSTSIENTTSNQTSAQSMVIATPLATVSTSTEPKQRIATERSLRNESIREMPKVPAIDLPTHTLPVEDTVVIGSPVSNDEIKDRSKPASTEADERVRNFSETHSENAASKTKSEPPTAGSQADSERRRSPLAISSTVDGNTDDSESDSEDESILSKHDDESDSEDDSLNSDNSVELSAADAKNIAQGMVIPRLHLSGEANGTAKPHESEREDEDDDVALFAKQARAKQHTPPALQNHFSQSGSAKHTAKRELTEREKLLLVRQPIIQAKAKKRELQRLRTVQRRYAAITGAINLQQKLDREGGQYRIDAMEIYYRGADAGTSAKSGDPSAPPPVVVDELGKKELQRELERQRQHIARMKVREIEELKRKRRIQEIEQKRREMAEREAERQRQIAEEEAMRKQQQHREHVLAMRARRLEAQKQREEMRSILLATPRDGEADSVKKSPKKPKKEPKEKVKEFLEKHEREQLNAAVAAAAVTAAAPTGTAEGSDGTAGSNGPTLLQRMRAKYGYMPSQHKYKPSYTPKCAEVIEREERERKEAQKKAHEKAKQMRERMKQFSEKSSKEHPVRVDAEKRAVVEMRKELIWSGRGKKPAISPVKKIKAASQLALLVAKATSDATPSKKEASGNGVATPTPSISAVTPQRKERSWNPPIANAADSPALMQRSASPTKRQISTQDLSGQAQISKMPEWTRERAATEAVAEVNAAKEKGRRLEGMLLLREKQLKSDGVLEQLEKKISKLAVAAEIYLEAIQKQLELVRDLDVDDTVW